MTEPTYTAAARHRHQAKPCPSCGQRREVGWADVSTIENQDQWMPVEKCRNRQCAEFIDPTSL